VRGRHRHEHDRARGSGGRVLLGASATRAQDGGLDAYLEAVRARHALPALAAAVVKDGEVIASGAVGVRALGTDVPVTVEDRFHLGSDTKAMTATLAGMMVDEGRLRWDSTIGEVLGSKVQGMNPALAALRWSSFCRTPAAFQPMAKRSRASTSTSTRSTSTSATSA
jgi:CubicO group peptidase (beta-lactamase class C family)